MRIKFSKTGGARFISHLDLMRTATRALRRANIPVSCTHGFNPHPYLVFSSPLSLGITSRCELLDIKLDYPLSPQQIMQMTQGAFPAGIEILDVYDGTKSFNDIMFAQYKISFLPQYAESFEAFTAQPEILVEKRAKKGKTVTLDLKPEFEILQVDGSFATLLLPCGNTKNIGVNLFAEAFRAFAGISDSAINIERLAFLDGDRNLFE